MKRDTWINKRPMRQMVSNHHSNAILTPTIKIGDNAEGSCPRRHCMYNQLKQGGSEIASPRCPTQPFILLAECSYTKQVWCHRCCLLLAGSKWDLPARVQETPIVNCESVKIISTSTRSAAASVRRIKREQEWIQSIPHWANMDEKCRAFSPKPR